MVNRHIKFDKPKLERLKKAYAKAVEDDVEQFNFEGHELVTNYAKYLIEHLENELEKSNG